MYKHDDYMVMDCDSAALSKTSPEAMTKYQREMAAVYNTIHSHDRVIDLMAIERGVDGTLLSLLCTLLGISVINTPERSKHYNYYIQVYGKGKKLPSTYLMDRLNNHESVWGFPYGSLGYPMYFYPTTYMHPSRMVELCAGHYLRVNASTDINHYKEPIQEVLNNLQVMGVALPRVSDWYLEGGYQYTPTTDMERKACTTVSAMARVWLQSGLAPISEGDLLHLTLPPQWRPLYGELIQVRKACEWIPSSSTGTVVEQLLLPLMSVSVLSNPQGLRTAMSYVLDICAPGGWDLLRVVLAAQAINKAYVEAYNNAGEPSIDIGGAGKLLLEAQASPLQRLGSLVMELNNGR